MNAIRNQLGFVGACATGAVFAAMAVLATGSDPLPAKIMALIHLFV